jgi:hypothetical protein
LVGFMIYTSVRQEAVEEANEIVNSVVPTAPEPAAASEPGAAPVEEPVEPGPAAPKAAMTELAKPVPAPKTKAAAKGAYRGTYVPTIFPDLQIKVPLGWNTDMQTLPNGLQIYALLVDEKMGANMTFVKLPKHSFTAQQINARFTKMAKKDPAFSSWVNQNLKAVNPKFKIAGHAFKVSINGTGMTNYKFFLKGGPKGDVNINITVVDGFEKNVGASILEILGSVK